MIINRVRAKLPIHSDRLTISLLSIRSHAWYTREVQKDYFNEYLDYQGVKQMTNEEVKHALLGIIASYKVPCIKHSELRLVIKNTTTKELLGGITIYDTINKGVVELGYWITPEHQGNGYAYESISRVIEVLKSMSSLRRIKLIIQERNAKSISLATKLGFSKYSIVKGTVCNNIIFIL